MRVRGQRLSKIREVALSLKPVAATLSGSSSRLSEGVGLLDSFSNQVRLPAELKHITKRRKRN